MDRDVAPLPAPVSPMFGREHETDVAVSLLCENGVRLLTLTGPGGVGKTRLAMEIGERSRATFDAVAFIPLATVHDSSTITREIASTFGIPDSTEPILGLRTLLGRRSALLILDNLEQLPDAGLALSPLLQALRGLSILATSRSRLAIAGEHVLPVEPLPIPPEDREDPIVLAESPAIRLLIASATATNVTYRYPSEELAVAAAIARRVDGLPLALQLSGSRLPLLGPRTLLRRLDAALPLLSDGPRDQPARLRTMRDAIAWSYDLLSDEERTYFRRLSLFSGGFTLEMAEAMARGWQADEGYPYLFGLPETMSWLPVGKEDPVFADDGRAPSTLPAIPVRPIEALDSLVRQNLIRPLRSEDGIERFDLLDTIRQFGLEQLEQHGETKAVRHAHAALMTGIAELCGVTMWGAGWRSAVAWIEAELPNIRAALGWLATQLPAANQLGLRLVEALWPFWQSRGYAGEGCAHLESALARSGGTPGGRAAALNVLGALRWIRDDLQSATAALDEALPILQELGFEAGLGRNFLFRALVAWNEDDYDRVEKMAQIGKKHFALDSDVLGEGMCSLMLGIAARARGEIVAAKEWFVASHQNFSDYQEGGFTWGTGIAQYYLGEIARQEGDRLRAVSHQRVALQMLIDIGDPWTVGGCIGTLATYLVADGELEAAARLLGAAHGLESSSGVFLPPTETAVHEAAARDVRKRIGPDAFAALFADGQQWSMEEAAARAMLVPMESAADRAARTPADRTGYVSPPLSERYLRTLRLMANGHNVKEIALAEGIAVSSVYERFERIKEQLDLPPHTSLAELMVFAIRHRIV